MSGDLSYFDRANNSLVGAYTTDTLPRGQDMMGGGFPDYVNSAASGQTQVSPKTDILGNVRKFILGPSLDTILQGGSANDAAAAASTSASNMTNAVVGGLTLKLIFFGLGAIFLGVGLWAMFAGGGSLPKVIEE